MGGIRAEDTHLAGVEQALLEVGCHAGPNFWSINRGKRWERLAGTELSRPVLSYAQATLPEALGRPLDLVHAAADALPCGGAAHST